MGKSVEKPADHAKSRPSRQPSSFEKTQCALDLFTGTAAGTVARTGSMRGMR